MPADRARPGVVVGDVVGDVVLGDDGRARCWWGDAPEIYRAYHDEEWGVAVHGRDPLYERLCLEAFQSGLSWLTVLRKRQEFRSVFASFDASLVARFADAEVTRLLGNPGIIRNRAKIEAAIHNARVVLALDDLDALLWSFAPPAAGHRPVDRTELPSTSPASSAMSADLKRRGFRFVGPTTAHALMQATGMVEQHLAGCWRAGVLRDPYPAHGTARGVDGEQYAAAVTTRRLSGAGSPTAP